MDYQQVNDYLTSIFNNVLVIEEVSLRGSRFKDISIKEMHTIDVIGKFPEATPSKVSKEDHSAAPAQEAVGHRSAGQIADV